MTPAQPVSAWRVFEIATKVTVLQPRGVTRVWLPTPLAVAPYQKTMGDTYHPGNGTAVMIETNANEPDMLGCSWDEGVEPVLTLVSRVATTGYVADLDTPTVPPPADMSGFGRFLKSARSVPIDPDVRRMAAEITKGAGTDIEQARAIHAAVTGNATADSRAHLDAAIRVVGLCRAAGIPARPVFGLDLSSPDGTRSQECRAEVYLAGYGWVPLDVGRRHTFGSWEMNWIAYNFAHDIELRGSSRPSLDYLMYPQGETAAGALDSLDPERFKYAITVRELDA
jgi:transglutaminase-like putative cysteine protease